MTPSRALLAAALAAAAGCDFAENYESESGPRYAGDFRSGPAEGGQEVLLVSYNLALGEDVPGAIEVLQTPPLAELDVLLMQEVDAPGTRQIAEALELAYVYYPASTSVTGADFGNAILSRFAVVDDAKHILPHYDPWSHRQRTATSATLDWLGRPLDVVCAHTAIPTLGLAARLEQAAVVADAPTHELALIGGDFNTSDPGSEEQTAGVFTERGFDWASGGVAPTVSRFGRDFRLDHLFVRGAETLGAGAFEDAAPGDHRPIWGLVRVP